MEKETKTCPYFGTCGGCDSIGKEYDATLNHKKEYVEKLLKPYGKLTGIAGMDNPYFYRNKVTKTFGMDQKKHPIAGIYQEKSHKIVAVKNCLIEDALASAILDTIEKLFASFKIKNYDERTGYGLVRHVQVRVGKQSRQVMVTIVTASVVFPSKNNFCKALRDKHPEITTIVQSVNERNTTFVLGSREIVLYGKGFITDTLCGKTFKISPSSFYQVNPVQTEKLYQKAIEFAGLTGKETVIDAYSGIGTIGLIASDLAKEVIGVELNKDAVKDAVSNAKHNKVGNVSFYTKDAGDFMVNLASQGKKADVVFMDPPRSGSTPAFLNALLTLKPTRIVYISCGPDSLARDLAVLTKGGYKMEKAMCYDMFPFTEHVETVCLLSKLHEAKHHINVKVDMDELDLTSAEAKATYKEIEEWVKEHYGFHVTNLNIAQVKQKHGIMERENYNKPKSENSRQPGTTPEKENAITEALKFFKMI